MPTFRPLALFAVLILAASAGQIIAASAAWAEDIQIGQKNKKFDKEEITVKKGDTITFVNDDPFTHNVYSETPGMAFDLKVQPPGKSSTVNFDTVGEALVECAIHPSMKLKVKVVAK
jgi:plastocyanin